MPETRTASRAALRIVLFGMPDAGKSSLLGALAQAAQTQEQALHGRLLDLGQGLADLQRRLYEEEPRQTVEELHPFPVAVEPLTGSGRTEAVLYDCDGRVANDLLSRRRGLEADTDNSLAAAVLAADTLILVVDAAAGPAQVEADFTEFARFLRLLEQSRGRRADVGGLPVFLVLTKCDLLSQPGDDLAAWMERIEEHKRQVGRRFEDFLARTAAATQLPFGSLHLHLWATAVKRPALQDSPAKPREPYGVAELFRQCFDAARVFRARMAHSGRRLFLTAAGAASTIGVLGVLAAVLFLNRPSERVSALELRADRFRARQEDLSTADRYADVPAKIDELQHIAADPVFARLPDTKREYVQRMLTELTAYQEFVRQLDDVPDPKEARTEQQLQAIRERLGRIVVPAEYQDGWNRTDAGRRRREWLEDVAAVETAYSDTLAAYRKLVRAGRQVLNTSEEGNLPRRAREVMNQARSVPNPQDDRDKLLPGSRRITYATVFDMTGLREVVRQWDEDIKKKLEPFARIAEGPP